MDNSRFKVPTNEEELIELVKRIALEEFDWECNIPISINPRLVTSNGRFIYRYNIRESKHTNLRFDFKPSLLENGIDEITNTIRHELVHWYSDTTNNRPCGHDETFISNCHKFGVTDFSDFARYRPQKPLSKSEFHEVKCATCHSTLAKSKNMSKLKRYMYWNGGTICGCGHAESYIMVKGVQYIYNRGRKESRGYNKDHEMMVIVAMSYNVELIINQ